jgi:hypothetical protein
VFALGACSCSANGGGEFSGDGVLRVRLVVCDAPALVIGHCHTPTWRRPRRDVYVVARAIDGSGQQLVGALSLRPEQGVPSAFPLGPGRYRATLRPSTFHGLSATMTSFTATKGSTTTITLAYAPT